MTKDPKEQECDQGINWQPCPYLKPCPMHDAPKEVPLEQGHAPGGKCVLCPEKKKTLKQALEEMRVHENYFTHRNGLCGEDAPCKFQDTKQEECLACEFVAKGGLCHPNLHTCKESEKYKTSPQPEIPEEVPPPLEEISETEFPLTAFIDEAYEHGRKDEAQSEIKGFMKTILEKTGSAIEARIEELTWVLQEDKKLGHDSILLEISIEARLKEYKKVK